MKVKYFGLTAVVLIAFAIIGYKTHSVAATQTAQSPSTPRVLLVANLGEANETGDACATIIRLVRAAGNRGVAVKELDANSNSPLLARYHVLVIPTVLILDQKGKVAYRLEGEGGNVVRKLRKKLAQLN